MPRRVRFNALLGGTWLRGKPDLELALDSCGAGRSEAAACEATVLAPDSLPICPRKDVAAVFERTTSASFIFESGTSALTAKQPEAGCIERRFRRATHA